MQGRCPWREGGSSSWAVMGEQFNGRVGRGWRGVCPGKQGFSECQNSPHTCANARGVGPQSLDFKPVLSQVTLKAPAWPHLIRFKGLNG